LRCTLVARKIPSRFPNITFIVPHLGGPLGDAARATRQSVFGGQKRAAGAAKRDGRAAFLLRHGGHGSHAALLCAWKAFGADHLLPGSDFPVLLNFETYARTFAWIREVGLPAADVDQILERNAAAVLGLAG